MNLPLSLEDHVSEFGRSLPAGSQVLDVGCGLRPYEHFFSHVHYLGIEVEVSGGGAHEKKPDAFFDGVNIPYPDLQFDAIISTQVLEHCIEPEKLIREMKRALKPDGRIYITVPFIWGEHQVPYDFRRFTSFGIKKIFSEAGLKPISFSRVNPGIDAIEHLVASEITHYSAKNPPNFVLKVMRRLSGKLWKLQLFLWRKIYQFDRIYLDNVLIVSKEDQ